MTTDPFSLGRFFREQAVYMVIAAAVGGVFWAIGQPINPVTILVYSLCIGNLISPPLIRLRFLYSERPFPYNWLILLAVLLVLMFPVYAISTVIVWWIAPPSPQSLWHLITTGWKLPFLITFLFGLINFLYRGTKERLERRNQELQRSVEVGAAELEMRDRELERAREIQESLLPKDISQLPGFEVSAAWRPARTVGGDYFDVLPLGDGKLAICIADVVGKGVAAALLMASVQATVRAFAHDSQSPAALCSRINGVLCGNIASEKFVTFLFGVLDGATHSFVYCNAGHPYPILWSGGSAHQLAHSGAVLGVLPAWKYEDSTIALRSGDRLLLFTDGITEAFGPEGEEFGEDNVAAFAQAHPTSSASQLTDQLLTRVAAFCGGQFEDDATLLVIAAN